MQHDELVKNYIHRLSTAVDRGRTNPTFNDDQRTAQRMKFSVRGFSPIDLKQKAQKVIVENPPVTWQQLTDQIATKDLSSAVGSEFIVTGSSCVDKKLETEGIKESI